MKDSIGGNSKTLMIVNVSPFLNNAEQTKSTLTQGKLAQQVKNDATQNIESEEVNKLKEEISVLKTRSDKIEVENDGLRKQVQNLTMKTHSTQ